MSASGQTRTAIVTGASSGIGQTLAGHLLDRGFRVAGFARWRNVPPPARSGFEPVTVDLSDPGAIEPALQTVLAGFDQQLDLLVNAAGFGRFPPHRHLDPVVLASMVSVNLTAPMVLCGLCLPALEARQGRMVNIASVTARHLGKRGAAYAATKAGLLHFSRNLFEEVRKSGVSVSTLIPDLTATPFYDNLDFAPAPDPEASVDLQAMRQALDAILDAPRGTVIEEITLRPRRLLIEKRPASPKR